MLNSTNRMETQSTLAMHKPGRAVGNPSDPMQAMNKVHCADVLPALRNIKTDVVFDVVIADPPYNIGKDFGNASDKQELSDYLAWSDG